MDKHLIDIYLTKLDQPDMNNLIKYMLMNYQEKIDIKDKRYLNFYPQSKKCIQIVLDTIREDDKYRINNIFFHHTSKVEWEFKIVKKMNSFKNTYLVKRNDNTGSSIIRFINEGILSKELKENTKVKSQVCGIVLLGEIHKDEQSYIDSETPDSNGNKLLLHDNTLIPYNLILNNNVNLSEKERASINHSSDSLLTFKSPLSNIKEVRVNLLGADLPSYYSATINTTYGKLPIIIPNVIVNKYKGKLKNGNVMIGELLLSGNVCIDKYTKLIEKNNNEEK